ncbi:MAG: 4-hydroxy-3-methylbut-2-enyl diphosphate reductase, partial [Candidatus Omnitrophica bacterium]|nr:4-hydroxy-3-methylbut-2-enyl diphosphate reductase [Candidatus Omnitrophota bacterium]MBD3268841.1 4-hydroxy-3-methylbut-2-enyl diphosphate reductase [Candidatus Omnitrophota bacterium]
LIRAHGTSLKVYKEAERLGYKIIDATCPMVKEIHKIAKEMEEKGYKIIIIGDKLHDEVKGIVGQLKKNALIIENEGTLPLDKLKRIKKAAVVVQSTQNLEKTARSVKALKRLIDDMKFFNTICEPTRQKQKEIRRLPKLNDLVIVIGSKASANTKRLYEIAGSLNKNTYWIRNEKQLRKEWFKGIDSVCVTAGASTPQETIKNTVKRIKKMGPPSLKT